MQKIKNLKAMEILDSRGNPTVSVVCELSDGTKAEASVPSGASTGSHEAVELRDGDMERYGGKGVLRAVENVNGEINEAVSGKEFDQKSLDEALIKLDGTENKSRLGANAILGVSLSFARASAISEKRELFEYIGELFDNEEFKLPVPMFNVINGGKHADSGLDIQEFMLVPLEFESFKERIRAGEEIIQELKKYLLEKGYTVGLGDEGGFAPKLEKNTDAFEILAEIIKKTGYEGKVKIGIDAAASSFYKGNTYYLKDDNKELDSSQLEEWYQSLVEKYPIFSIEDGFAEEDWEGFEGMLGELGGEIKVVGDDLTVTNPKRIKEAVEKKAINTVIIKPNQIGTLTETLEAVKTAKGFGVETIVSHRSGETMDTFISDLSVGISSGYMKSGSLARGERVCKYNRLLEIEEKLKSRTN